jgi:hypothetical protein
MLMQTQVGNVAKVVPVSLSSYVCVCGGHVDILNCVQDFSFVSLVRRISVGVLVKVTPGVGGSGYHFIPCTFK